MTMLLKCLDTLGIYEPVYSKTQPVHTCGSLKVGPLEVNIYVAWFQSKSSDRYVFLQVTDDSDPDLLYSLIVSEKDYVYFKHIRHINHDFSGFPQHMAVLFEINEQSQRFIELGDNADEDPKGSWKSSLTVYSDDNVFDIEIQLQLPITAGIDGNIMRLLSNEIKILNEENNRLEGNISFLDAKVSHLSHELDRKRKELNLIYNSIDLIDVNELACSDSQIDVEINKLRKAREEWLFTMKMKKIDLEQKYFNILKDKEEEMTKLLFDNRNLTDRKILWDSVPNLRLPIIKKLETDIKRVDNSIIRLDDAIETVM